MNQTNKTIIHSQNKYKWPFLPSFSSLHDQVGYFYKINMCILNKTMEGRLLYAVLFLNDMPIIYLKNVLWIYYSSKLMFSRDQLSGTFKEMKINKASSNMSSKFAAKWYLWQKEDALWTKFNANFNMTSCIHMGEFFNEIRTFKGMW